MLWGYPCVHFVNLRGVWKVYVFEGSGWWWYTKRRLDYTQYARGAAYILSLLTVVWLHLRRFSHLQKLVFRINLFRS